MRLVRLFPGALACYTFIAPVGLSSESPPVPFDYFTNSWQVIGLPDYRDGTRVTPENELLLAGGARLRLGFGQPATGLSHTQTKTLREGWLPIVHLVSVNQGVHYAWTLWATPLPTVANWRAAFAGPTAGENYLNWVLVRASNRTSRPTPAAVEVSLVASNRVVPLAWQQMLPAAGHADVAFSIPFQIGRASCRERV